MVESAAGVSLPHCNIGVNMDGSLVEARLEPADDGGADRFMARISNERAIRVLGLP